MYQPKICKAKINKTLINPTNFKSEGIHSKTNKISLYRINFKIPKIKIIKMHSNSKAIKIKAVKINFKALLILSLVAIISIRIVIKVLGSN